jgi:hypothetical protein
MRAVCPATLVAVSVLGCGRTATEPIPDGCITDLDCKRGRICVQGACEDSPALGSSAGRANAGGSAAVGGSSSGTGGTGGATAGGAGVAGAAASSGSAGSGAVVEVDMTPLRLDIHANRLAVDRVRGKLYAAVGTRAPAHANELVVIDADHAAIEAKVMLGSDPDVLAISDDDTRLWVGLHGSGTIREVDLTSWPPAPGDEYPVPPLSYHEDGVFGGSMAVLPEQPESVALTLDCTSCGAGELVVMDSGIPRARRLGGPSISALASGPPGYVFGFNGSDTGFDFSTIVVDETGPTENSFWGLITGFGTEIVYHGKHVIASSGQVLDVSSPDSPVRSGTFAYEGKLVPHPEREKVVMLSYVKAPTYESTRNVRNELVLRQLDLPAFREDFATVLAGKYATVHDFVEVKSGLFAFIDTEDDDFASKPGRASIYLFRAPDFAE